MKQTRFFLMVLLITIFCPKQSYAQDAFSTFEVYNRVLLVNYSDAITEDLKLEIVKLFKGLSKKVDGLEWVYVADITKSSQGFDQAITLTFASAAGLEKYVEHPDHKRIQELSTGAIKETASYEYWEKME